MSKFKKTPYKIDVRDIINRPGTQHDRHLDLIVSEDLGEGLVAVKAGSTMELDLRLEAIHEGILVTAEVSGIAAGECGRCLIDIELPVRVEFVELFAYSQDEAFDYEVHDDTIDLEPVVRDAVVLSLPFQPVCQEDCLGLCPQCGVRLLDNPGHEHEAPVDPRWAALSGLAGQTGASADDVDGAGNDGATEEKR